MEDDDVSSYHLLGSQFINETKAKNKKSNGLNDAFSDNDSFFVDNIDEIMGISVKEKS
jgi:hypothetical protein